MAEERFVTFSLAGQRYGIPIILVREIQRHLEITPVQNGPDFISGLANLRGQIITVFDAAVRLGIAKGARREETHCIVLKTKAELSTSPALQSQPDLLEHAGWDLTGLLVEEINDVVLGRPGNLEPVPANLREVETRFLSAVLKEEAELLLLLNMGEFLDLETLRS